MNCLHESQHRVFKECPSGQRSLGGLGDVLRPLRPHGLQEAVLRIEQKTLEVLEEGVSILLDEARDCVDHVPGIMLDQEVLAVTQHLVHGVGPPRGVVIVGLELPVHLLQERDVGDLAHVEAGLIHGCDDALVLLLNQLTDNHVIEVLDVLPLDALPLVFLLLLLQYQLYKIQNINIGPTQRKSRDFGLDEQSNQAKYTHL